MTERNNGYKAFYNGRVIEVFANSSYQAQLQAAKQFKARKNYEVSVVLCQMADGTQITHSTAID